MTVKKYAISFNILHTKKNNAMVKIKCKFCEYIRTACRKIGKTPNKAIENVTMAKLWLLDVKRDANKTDANIAAFNDNVP